LFSEKIATERYSKIIFDLPSVKQYLTELNRFIGTDALKSSILEDCISSLCKKEEQFEISTKITEVLSELYIRKITKIDKTILAVLPSDELKHLTDSELDETLLKLSKSSENLKLNLTYMITAPPGTGKTTIAKICSGLMASLGIISQPNSKLVSGNKISETEHRIKMIQKYGDIFQALERQVNLVKELEKSEAKVKNPDYKDVAGKFDEMLNLIDANIYALDEMPTKNYNKVKSVLPAIYSELRDLKSHAKDLEKNFTKYHRNASTIKKAIENCSVYTSNNFQCLATDMSPFLACGKNPVNPNYKKMKPGQIVKGVNLRTFIETVFGVPPADLSPEDDDTETEREESDEDCCSSGCSDGGNINTKPTDSKELNFGVYSREHFVAGYVGQSALKTIALLNKHLGGTMVIDEAYSLILEDGKDSFGMEVLTTINRFITEHLGEIVIYFAGYEDKMQALFNSQPGLKRRIHKTYKIENYNAKQLSKIFISQLADKGIIVDSEEFIQAHFADNLKKYPHFGGDTFMLVQSCSIILDIEKFKLGKDEIPLHPTNMLTKKMFMKAFNRFEGSKGDVKEDITKKPEYLNFYL
jgi:hypothetical protein